jgi:hypothetical protein
MSEQPESAAHGWRTWADPRAIVIVAVLLSVLLLNLLWPAPEPGRVVLLGRGSLGESRWAVLMTQRQSDVRACLQVRIDGALRRTMCDRDWQHPAGVNLWHGKLPQPPGNEFGPPSLLRVTFPGSDQVLVVSVLSGEIARLSLAGPPGTPDLALPVHQVINSENAYVLAVLPKARAGEPTAYDSKGRPVYYRFLRY